MLYHKYKDFRIKDLCHLGNTTNSYSENEVGSTIQNFALHCISVINPHHHCPVQNPPVFGLHPRRPNAIWSLFSLLACSHSRLWTYSEQLLGPINWITGFSITINSLSTDGANFFSPRLARIWIIKLNFFLCLHGRCLIKTFGKLKDVEWSQTILNGKKKMAF